MSKVEVSLASENAEKRDGEKRLGNAGDKQDANVMRQQFYFLILLHQVQLVSRNANFSFVVTIFPFSF